MTTETGSKIEDEVEVASEVTGEVQPEFVQAIAKATAEAVIEVADQLVTEAEATPETKPVVKRKKYKKKPKVRKKKVKTKSYELYYKTGTSDEESHKVWQVKPPSGLLSAQIARVERDRKGGAVIATVAARCDGGTRTIQQNGENIEVPKYNNKRTKVYLLAKQIGKVRIRPTEAVIKV